MRTKKAIVNTITAIISQIVSIVCGFVVPRLILSAFGSSYNGITSSISQFISCVVLLRAGIGGVTRAALYKPLAESDGTRISRIVKATDIFMKKVSLIFAGALFAFACIYPCLVRNEFEWIFTFSLVLILGINTFAQNYFGITYQILIQADQSHYVFSALSIFTTILNTIVAAILIKSGASIHMVKLGSSIVFALNPIILNVYVTRKYKLDKTVEPDNSAIEQRWAAFAQQIAAFVNNNTDVIILTMFCDIKEVSVYTVYHMVTNGLYRIEQTISNGLDAAFGNMIAKKERETLQNNFKLLEFIIFALSSVLFISGAILIVPFAEVYTRGVTDVSYSRTFFGVLMCINQFLCCVRLPYQMIAEASGHFRKTRNGAILECVINVVVSIMLVAKWGLIGVSIGTLCAMLFRTIQYVCYSSKNILERNIKGVIKHWIATIIEATGAFFIVKTVDNIVVTSYFDLFIYAIAIVLFVVIEVFFASMVFYKDELRMFYKKILNIAHKK